MTTKYRLITPGDSNQPYWVTRAWNADHWTVIDNRETLTTWGNVEVRTVVSADVEYVRRTGNLPTEQQA